jgi:hypothetical protein
MRDALDSWHDGRRVCGAGCRASTRCFGRATASYDRYREHNKNPLAHTHRLPALEWTRHDTSSFTKETEPEVGARQRESMAKASRSALGSGAHTPTAQVRTRRH